MLARGMILEVRTQERAGPRCELWVEIARVDGLVVSAERRLQTGVANLF